MRTIAQLQGWRVVLLACVPTLFVLWRADAATRSKPKRLLSEIATSSNALVNISAADIPASPDLLELGRSATPALGRCLADNPAEALRAECGDLLGVLGDPLALPQLHAALEDW